MWTIRDIISEALARANIVGRRQVQHAPGDKVMDALDILRDIAADFTSKNLLQWLQETVEVKPNMPPQYVVGGEYTEGVNFWFVENGAYGMLPTATAGLYAQQAHGWDVEANVIYSISRIGHSDNWTWTSQTFSNVDECVAHLNNAIKVIPGGLRTEVILGEVDPDETVNYDYVDVVCKGLDKIVAVYYELTNPDANGDYSYPLEFVSYEDFWNGGWGPNVYTWQPISDRKVKLYIKQSMVSQLAGQSYGMKVIFNKAWQFDLDSVVKAPDVYRSLFLSALTYRLAERFPRLDPAHTHRLKEEMEDRIATVSSKTRALKYISREGVCTDHRLVRPSQLASGSFIYGA